MKRDWESTGDRKKLYRLAAKARKDDENQPAAVTKFWEFAGGDLGLNDFLEAGETFGDVIDEAIARIERESAEVR